LATALEQSGHNQAHKEKTTVHYSVANSEDVRNMFGKARNEIHGS
jgi:hypothetical protein